MKKHLLSLLAMGMVSGAFFSASASMPAKGGVRTALQPDGTILNYEMRGGRTNHASFTEDGYMILKGEDGVYRYAVVGENGLPAISSVVAHNPAGRDASEKKFVGGLNREEVVSSLLRRDELRSDALFSRRSASRRSATVNPDGYPMGPGLFETSFPKKGSPKALVILVSYSDLDFRLGDDAHRYFTDFLNKKGFSDYNATGCVSEWFEFNSNGIFTPEFDLYGPVKLPHSYSYYGKNDYYDDEPNAYQMVTDACSILDDTVDFSRYDNDGDGFVDNIYIFYAGFGQADYTEDDDVVWPHSAFIADYDSEPYIYDGVRVNLYGCSNEWPYDVYSRRPENYPDGIGTFVHEFSHVLGLPDLYDTYYTGGCFTPGTWSAMDVGPYNNDGKTPPNYSSYERYALGWIEPKELNGSGDFTLGNLAETNECFIVKCSDLNEYYLFENRQQIGNDRYIPYHGMLVWHIDYDPVIWEKNIVNNTRNHQYVDLVEADNIKTAKTLTGDAFPGTAKRTSFGETTNPALKDWDGNTLGVNLTKITETDGVISFHAEVAGSGVRTLGTESLGLRVNALSVSADEEIELYDLAGRLIASGREVSASAPGFYLVKGTSGTSKLLLK